ncbi:MAG: hypothetical protein HZR80_00030 [Candidatus Heimdallarchaeota archaeon]
MNVKTFLIGLLIILVATVIFTLPAESVPLLIPSLLFAGVAGGLYVGYVRKRPLITCLYDGLIVSIPASLLQAVVVVLILWFYHNLRVDNTPIKLVVIIFAISIMLGGVVGGPFGGLALGLYYRYVKRDRGEGELYEKYLEEKIRDDDKKKLEE